MATPDPQVADDPRAPRHLVLVGMMGAGKSTVGREVAGRLGRGFVDLDDVVEQRSGRSVPELFAADGEPAFRRLEREALEEVLDEDEALVVATGGGAVLDPDNRAAMRRRGTVVWLRARADVLAARVGHGEGRPLLAAPGVGADRQVDGPGGRHDDLTGRIEHLAACRESLYHQAANDVINVDDLSPDEVADMLVAFVRSEPR